MQDPLSLLHIEIRTDMEHIWQVHPVVLALWDMKKNTSFTF